MPEPDEMMSLLGSVGTAAQPALPAQLSSLGLHKTARKTSKVTLWLPSEELLFRHECSSLARKLRL